MPKTAQARGSKEARGSKPQATPGVGIELLPRETRGGHMCEMPGDCLRTGAVLVAICGHPAGIYCKKHAAEMKQVWCDAAGRIDDK